MSLNRDEWLAELAGKLTAHPNLKSGGTAAASDLADLATADIATAVLITGVSELHASGQLLEEIVERMARGRWVEPGRDLVEAAMDCISIFRAGQLPGPDWWDPGPLYAALLECWAAMARKMAPKDGVEELLQRRWLVDESLIEAIREPRGSDVATCRETIERWVDADPRFAQLWSLSSIQAAITAEREALPEIAQSHHDLLDIATGLSFRRQLATLLDEVQDTEAKAALAECRTELEVAVRQQLDAQSVFETKLVVADTTSRRMLRDAAARSRKHFS